MAKIIFILAIALLAWASYIINTDESGGWVKMNGTVEGKAIMREYGKYAEESPKLGITFDDGIERDVTVTLASYARFEKGDRIRVLVRTEETAIKSLAYMCLLASLFFGYFSGVCLYLDNKYG